MCRKCKQVTQSNFINMNTKKMGEVHSRREFFKRVAKKVVPVLALTTVALIIPENVEATGCSRADCYGKCWDACHLNCSGGCHQNCSSCKGTCSGRCQGGCQGSCKSGCDGSCQDSSR